MSFDPETERKAQYEEAMKYFASRLQELKDETQDISDIVDHFGENHAEAYAGYDYYRTKTESKKQ